MVMASSLPKGYQKKCAGFAVYGVRNVSTKHQVTMRWHEGNARGPGWFSHQLADGSYCKGK